MLMRRASWTLTLLVPAILLGACDGKAKEEMSRRLNDASEKLLQCRKETNDLRNEVAGLKRQLAQAMANPSRVVLTDPDIINLIASIRGGAGGEEDLLGKGALDPKVASKIVNEGAVALRQCYERALKKNQALQYQSGVGLTLEITIRPQGTVESVEVSPSIDREMTACIKTTAARWKFPAFSGKAVIVSQKLTLTPTKT
jgi:hypothetical protein